MYWVALVSSLVLALLLLSLAPRLLRHQGLVDTPNERSSHSKPTLRGAGILLGFAALCVSGLLGLPWVIVFSLALFVILGFLDDLFRLPAVPRLAAQFIFAGVFVWLVLASARFDAGGVVLGGLLTILVVVIVNETNFMDGINGISIGCGLAMSISFAVLLGLAGQDSYAVLAMCLAGVCLAFAPWNFRTNARLFLGDSGSYLLGVGFAASVVVLIAAGINPLVALAPLTLYLFDATSAIIRRVLRRQNPFLAHRGHAYQRLVDDGVRHIAVSLMASFATVICGLLAVVTFLGFLPTVILFVACVAIGVSWITAPLLVKSWFHG